MNETVPVGQAMFGPGHPERDAGIPGLLLSQGISGSIALEAENTESLSHTYF